jgi:hypothetical protein
MLWIMRLDPGKTVADYARAVTAREPTPWARKLGGPSFAFPPATTNATLVLDAGSYVLGCLVGGARENLARHHLLRGMFRGLTVTPTAAPRAELPVPDVVVRISESGAIQLSTPILAGRRVLRVENAGGRAHELIVRRIVAGRTAADLAAWRAQGRSTAPPLEPLGGLSHVPSGSALITTMTFEPGDYVIRGAEPFAFTVLPARR